MEYTFSAHAVQRMIERRLTPADINAVISRPDGTIPQSRDKTIFFKRLRNRKDNLIAVVAVKKSNQVSLEIITVLINFEVRA
jgi:hypothetical protein